MSAGCVPAKKQKKHQLRSNGLSSLTELHPLDVARLMPALVLMPGLKAVKVMAMLMISKTGNFNLTDMLQPALL